MSENSEQNMPTLIISDVGTQNITNVPQQNMLNQSVLSGGLDNQVSNVPLTQQPVVQQSVVQQPVVQQPVVQQPVVQQPVVQQPVIQQPVIQQPVIQQPVVQQSVVQQPVAQQEASNVSVVPVVPVNQQLPQPIPTTNHQNINIVVPNINNPETNIDKSINDHANSLENVDKQFIKQLYEQYKNIILNGFSGKSVNDLNSTFWINILVQLMVSVEGIKLSGVKKKDLVIETVCLVIRNDLPIGDNEKGIVESVFKSIGPGLVDTVIFASANINITPQDVKKCFSCCFPSKKKK